MQCKTTAEMKRMDEIAIRERGIPSLELMENAAAHVTQAVLAELAERDPSNGKTDKGKQKGMVLVFCGVGNNGGDGFACARQLLEQGVSVCVWQVGNAQKRTPDATAEAKRFCDAGGRINSFLETACTVGEGGGLFADCVCIVDALFGVGLSRPVGGLFALAVEQINRSGIPVIACDIPSGVDGDSGQVLGTAVQAQKTVTFSCAKPGLLMGAGKELAGMLEIVDIGIPKDLL